MHAPRASNQPQGTQHIHTRTIEIEDVTGEIAPIVAHMDAARFAFDHGEFGRWGFGVLDLRGRRLSELEQLARE